MKPEEVTDEMYAAFCTAYTNGPAATFMSYCAGIAAAITVHERDAGRGQLPPLTEVPEHVIAAIEKYIGHSIWKNLGEASRLINIALVCLNADRATPAGATSSPVIHKFGDQYVAVCGDDAVNHKITEFWEYVTCKDCLKKGSAAPAEATGDGWTYYKPAEGSCFRNRHRVKGETVEEYYRKKWMSEVDQAKDIFFNAIRDGKIILDPNQTESGEPAPTPAVAPSEPVAPANDATRFQAACAAMTGIAGSPMYRGTIQENAADAVKFADALLAELRKRA